MTPPHTTHNPTTRNPRPCGLGRSATLLAVASLVLGVPGCAQPKGVLFEPLDSPLSWPPPPEAARIDYVGELRTDKDLKPGRSFFAGMGESLFGAEPAHAMRTPFACCTDGGDRLFVADSNAHTVHVFDLQTRRYEQWTPEEPAAFAQPVAVAYDPAGRLLVADSVAGVIHAFDEGGRYTGTLGEGLLERPTGIAVDPTNERLFVADAAAHEVVVLTPAGGLIRRLGERGTQPGQFNFPTGVAVGPGGSLYVSDTLNFRVQVFDAALNPVLQIGSKGDLPGYFSHPKGIALNSAGHLYVVDSHFESVQIFDRQGRLLLTFGEEGPGPGQFWMPTGVHIDADDRVWVTDSYNQRVQVFDYRSEEGP
ncbi:MAG: DNA-binding beta-propeller fold protein YncE [Phycisphaerales bacterium]|jgi:DNA-binding beta-propeller fold protein YncE